MGRVYTAVSLDDAFDCYEKSKRNVSKEPLYYYDLAKNEFIKIKGTMKNTGIVFINSYQLCSRLIDEYLNQPGMNKHKKAFSETKDWRKSKIVEFLWYFEHIDGCYGFRDFEIPRVATELKKWCKKNGLNYIEPHVYRIE